MMKNKDSVKVEDNCKGCPFSYPASSLCHECQGGKNKWVLEQVIHNMIENGVPLYLAAM